MCDSITFKNIVFQNGGNKSAQLSASGSNYAEHVTFDHCTFNVSRNGVNFTWPQYACFLPCVFSRPALLRRFNSTGWTLLAGWSGSAYSLGQIFGTTAWTHYSTAQTAPSTAVTPKLKILLDGGTTGGFTYFDDFYVK